MYRLYICRKEFNASGINRLALNAITKSEIPSVISNRSLCTDTLHLFSHKIATPEFKVCSQKASGRCWIFAALNVMRLGLGKPCNLAELELSQPYLFYWDKIEKSNYFLENVLATLNEPEDGRVFQFLLQNPVQDGGQWDMIGE